MKEVDISHIENTENTIYYPLPGINIVCSICTIRKQSKEMVWLKARYHFLPP